MTTKDYLKSVKDKHSKGNATEHSYRGVLENLLTTLAIDCEITNEPSREKWGMPDYLIERNSIPIGYIEAKDIGDNDIKGEKPRGNKKQFDRYKQNANNLLITDYLEFYLYRNGELVNEVKIGEFKKNKIEILDANIKDFELLIDSFVNFKPESITTTEGLTTMMANKARMLANVMNHSLSEGADEDLKEQYEAFKNQLIEDIKPEEFSDVYAQTIVYGMFAARIKDASLENFTRIESVELIPDNNPFIKSLFTYISSVNINKNIKDIIEDLVSIFAVCNVKEVLKNYGTDHKMQDPIIHFYEDFLNQYDPETRKARGVWYTPEPIVKFIVKMSSYLLEKNFNLTGGLLDASKAKLRNAKRQLYDTNQHRLQIIDPATGTGTFISKIIEYTKDKIRMNDSHWSEYVNKNIIPRTHGFELLMASYAMAHIHTDLLLEEQGCTKHDRMKIYLTNSLEQGVKQQGSFFAKKLAEEANAAAEIKNIKRLDELGELSDDIVPLVIGNPPYSVSSTNKGEMIMNLLNDYKKESDGSKLKEKQSKSLNDDYVKFIRFGQKIIHDCEQGVMAYINPHGFIDNVTFRGMRYSLLKEFDEIYIIDLHGNMRKGLTRADGTKDENVFNIMQGVSINFFVKTGKKADGELAKVYYNEVLGNKELKFEKLSNNSIYDIYWTNIEINEKTYDFKPSSNINLEEEYNKGIKIEELFTLSNSGIQTHKDGIIVQTRKETFLPIINDFKLLTETELRLKYDVQEDGACWKLLKGVEAIKNSEYQIIKHLYRPFDYRYMLYSIIPKALVAYHRHDTTKHFLSYPNIGLVFSRQQTKGEAFDRISITKDPVDYHTLSAGCKFAPLYLYDEYDNKIPNLDYSIASDFAERIGLRYQAATVYSCTGKSLTPSDLLSYIYGVLHDNNYRKEYNELLKKDFPRVKYPESLDEFNKYKEFGKELISLHLLEKNTIEHQLIGNDINIDKISYKDNKIFINKESYFEGVTKEMWDYTIGGYQPLQKWLKDRKGEELSYEDCNTYCKIINSIKETIKLIKNI